MKNLTFIPFIILGCYLLQQILPWWVIAPVAFAICYFFKPGKFAAFAGSLLAVFLLWVIKAYFADKNFDVPASGLLSGLLGNVSSSAIYFLTGITGGLVAGLSGLLGDWTRQLSQDKL